ncbi:MAG: hypothetical protein ABI835_06340 [Chloroflexota bacterium]
MASTLTKTTPSRINTQQLAWGVMLSAFAIFCVIAGAAFLGVRYFLFQSRVPLASIVEVSRGTPTVTMIGQDLVQTAVTRSGDITAGSVLTTNTESQAVLRFADPQQTDKVIASVTVGTGSSVNLQQGSRPRFNWSEDPYWIDFEDVYGTIDVFIPENLGRAVLLSFDTTLGPVARLSESGRYSVIAAGGRVQVANYAGEAVLDSPDERTQIVAAGQTGSLPENSSQFTLLPLNNLLGDDKFTIENVVDFNSTPDQVRAQAWRCVNNVDNPDQPLGSFQVTDIDYRSALRLFRGDNAISHGETRCWQGLGTAMSGLDVSGYRSISIRATFMIQSQSLSACGVDGSECPLMLSMDYIPNKGDAVSWFHGFYASVDPSRLFPSGCLSCNEQHERITPGVWYTYESHNLFETFAPDVQPKSILNLRFYASGHQYDVYVNEVTLIADDVPIAEVPIGEATPAS